MKKIITLLLCVTSQLWSQNKFQMDIDYAVFSVDKNLSDLELYH